MRYAVIADGVVTNVVEAQDADAIPGATLAACPDNVGMGWSYNGVTFSAPTPAIIVPTSATMRQARLALLAAGKLAEVESAIAAMSEPAQSAARIEWEYAATVDRASPLIAALSPALGLDDKAIDALFIDAETR